MLRILSARLYRPLFLLFLLAITGVSCSKMPDVEKLTLYDGDHMKQTRKELRRGFSGYRKAYTQLMDDAGRAMRSEGWSVTYKTTLPGTVLLHDYISVPEGWGPHPLAKDGLPWQRNSEESGGENLPDYQQLKALARDVRSLALAWFYNGERPYALHAAELLRTWFLTPETKMEPQLEWAQSIPGRTAGRYTGLREGLLLTEMLDAVMMVEAAGTLKRAEEKELRGWFQSYLDWLLQSRQGGEATAFPGYDAIVFHYQAAVLAHFLEQDELSVTHQNEAWGLLSQLFREDGRPNSTAARPIDGDNALASAGLLVDLLRLALRMETGGVALDDPNGQRLFKAIDWLAQNHAPLSPEGLVRSVDGSSSAALGLVIRSAAALYSYPEFKIVWAESFETEFKTDWRLLVFAEP